MSANLAAPPLTLRPLARRVGGGLRLVGEACDAPGPVSVLLPHGSGLACVRGLVTVDTAPQLDPTAIDWLVEFLGGEAERGFDSPAAALAHVCRFCPALAVPAENIEKSLRRDAAPRSFRATGCTPSVQQRGEPADHGVARRIPTPRHARPLRE